MHRNHLCNFGRGNHEELFREIDLKLDHWFRRFCLKEFLSCALAALVFSGVTYFYRPFQGGTSFVDHLCYLCPVFVARSCLFVAALWSPEGKGLTSWLLFVMFFCDFVTFPFGILGQEWSLIVSITGH